MKTYLKNLLEELSGPRPVGTSDGDNKFVFKNHNESYSLALVSVFRMVLEGTRFNMKGIGSGVDRSYATINEKDSPFRYRISVSVERKPHWSEFNMEQTKRCVYCGTDHYEPEMRCGSVDFTPAWFKTGYEGDSEHLFSEDEIDWSGYEKQT